ncbi:hypothetical protein Z043_120220 [Scleropages formosus]|uniref:MGT5A-like N-terminal domain-containing protein n=1 Tax=Scleropages formosus TaxID=113540 RepID=A0A0P7TVF3_SCLFO|nr:hypothetical protein Z043_120220 [Scleropages formosus]
MGSVFLWKLSSQKLGFFLVSFGFIWGMMLLHFTIQQRAQHESSAALRQQILELSKRYVKALAEENHSVMDGPYVGTMTAYGERRLPAIVPRSPFGEVALSCATAVRRCVDPQWFMSLLMRFGRHRLTAFVTRG